MQQNDIEGVSFVFIYFSGRNILAEQTAAEFLMNSKTIPVSPVLKQTTDLAIILYPSF